MGSHRRLRTFDGPEFAEALAITDKLPADLLYRLSYLVKRRWPDGHVKREPVGWCPFAHIGIISRFLRDHSKGGGGEYLLRLHLDQRPAWPNDLLPFFEPSQRSIIAAIPLRGIKRNDGPPNDSDDQEERRYRIQRSLDREVSSRANSRGKTSRLQDPEDDRLPGRDSFRRTLLSLEHIRSSVANGSSETALSCLNELIADLGEHLRDM